jgi:hypothetical protein
MERVEQSSRTPAGRVPALVLAATTTAVPRVQAASALRVIAFTPSIHPAPRDGS